MADSDTISSTVPAGRGMTLEQFAKAAGVSLVECDPEWGGRIGYTTQDGPRCTISGFRTQGAAYKHWLEDTFGKQTSKAVQRLLTRR